MSSESGTATWRRRLADLFRPFPATPPEIRDNVIRLQHERLHELTPLLHLTIAANTLAMAVAVLGDLPWWQQATPPGLILLSAVWHLLRWRRAGRAIPVEQAYAKLRRSVPLAGALGLVAGIWGVNAFTETEKFYCIVAPVFVALSALVSANCLTSVPRAAIAAMIGALSPLVVKMLLFPNIGIRSMAVMLVLIGLLQGRLVLAKFADTVKLLALQHEIARIAETDALTGRANRRALEARVAAELAANRDVVLALIDLDGFKAVNDTHGHHAGDAVLVEVGARLVRIAPSALCVARLGGDEFALAFTGAAGPAQVAREIDAARAAIGLPCVIEGTIMTVTASIGTAQSSGDGQTLPELMRAADRALYGDKGRGREAGARRAA